MTTAIVGRTGSGKTFAAKTMVEPELAAGARVCVIDPTGAWWGLRLGADGGAGGFPVVIFGGDHADVPIGAGHGEQLADLVVAGEPRQCVVDIAEMSGGEQTRFLTAFLERLYTKNRAPLLLVMDEADVMAPQNPMPDQRRLQGAVNKIVRRGRIKGFRPVMITQRPAVLDKSVLSQIDTLVAMRLTSPQDRKAIEAWVQGNADAGESKSVLDSLASLPRGEGWFWAPAEGVLERRVFPAITTFDSGRSPELGDEPFGVTVLPLPELDALRAMFMSSTAKEAEKMNPASEAPVSATGVMSRPDPELIMQAERRGYERGLADGRAALLEGVRANLDAAGRQFAERLREIGEALDQTAGDAGEAEPQKARCDSAPQTSAPVARPAPQPNLKMAPDPQPGVTPAKKKVLDAIAWLSAFGNVAPSRIQVAMVAGVSHVSSSFANNLGALRSAGLIDYPQPNALKLTNEGWTIAERPEHPPTHRHVMDLLRERLPPAQMRLLDKIAETYPIGLFRTVLAELAGVSSTSSSFANNLGRLSSLGLITYPRQGSVRAADALFPSAR